MATHEHDNTAVSQRFIGEFVDGATDDLVGEMPTEGDTRLAPARPGSRSGRDPPGV